RLRQIFKTIDYRMRLACGSAAIAQGYLLQSRRVARFEFVARPGVLGAGRARATGGQVFQVEAAEGVAVAHRHVAAQRVARCTGQDPDAVALITHGLVAGNLAVCREQAESQRSITIGRVSHHLANPTDGDPNRSVVIGDVAFHEEHETVDVQTTRDV